MFNLWHGKKSENYHFQVYIARDFRCLCRNSHLCIAFSTIEMFRAEKASNLSKFPGFQIKKYITI